MPLISANVAEIMLNPQPSGSSVEGEVKLLLVRADVELGVDLNIKEVEKILLNVVFVLRIKAHKVFSKSWSVATTWLL